MACERIDSCASYGEQSPRGLTFESPPYDPGSPAYVDEPLGSNIRDTMALDDINTYADCRECSPSGLTFESPPYDPGSPALSYVDEPLGSNIRDTMALDDINTYADCRECSPSGLTFESPPYDPGSPALSYVDEPLGSNIRDTMALDDINTYADCRECSPSGLTFESPPYDPGSPALLLNGDFTLNGPGNFIHNDKNPVSICPARNGAPSNLRNTPRAPSLLNIKDDQHFQQKHPWDRHHDTVSDRLEGLITQMARRTRMKEQAFSEKSKILTQAKGLLVEEFTEVKRRALYLDKRATSLHAELVIGNKLPSSGVEQLKTEIKAFQLILDSISDSGIDTFDSISTPDALMEPRVTIPRVDESSYVSSSDRSALIKLQVAEDKQVKLSISWDNCLSDLQSINTSIKKELLNLVIPAYALVERMADRVELWQNPALGIKAFKKDLEFICNDARRLRSMAERSQRFFEVAV